MTEGGYDEMKELGTNVRSELSMIGREDTTGIVYSIWCDIQKVNCSHSKKNVISHFLKSKI